MRYLPQGLWHLRRRKRTEKSKRYARIDDNYDSIEQVKEALRNAGLESSNLIIAVDFTKSNEWTGEKSFEGKSLHDLDHPTLNPYEQAISIIGQTLSGFDEDDLIPCYGFGDVTTHDEDVFSFLPDDKPCKGFEEVLRVYREIAPRVRLSGPTSFAPIIETAINIVDKVEVTRSDEIPHGKFSLQETKTINALVKASEYPLSIVCVGVGDGPWETMKMFDDFVPARTFDNFQFVDFTEIMQENTNQGKEAKFALEALMETPGQYQAILSLNLLGQRKGVSGKPPLPPPCRTIVTCIYMYIYIYVPFLTVE
ncbi:unnamed protein product [Spirodela intermedia]|uniref:Copine C-terminal domain-containing protein n=1 Tax=Spirodela intermedia TaxID=51605 RepID=A0A7I8JIY3_SPIIN|nr:unnamed protein product [Spirodela intermedia]CAA6670114.1 unnamed protein product [Spirodela intermedia]